MRILRQSTAVTVAIGPFVDDADGNTAETGLTISQADVRLSKNGGNMAQKNEASACTHDELGIYACSLDATDTGTLGRLALFVHESGALPVWERFMVSPANVYDSWFGSDKQQVDVVQGQGSALILTGTVDTVTNSHTPTTTEFQADDITEATADHYNGRVVLFTSGALVGQVAVIEDYEAVGGIGQFTVRAMTEAPANNDTFVIL